MTRMNMTRHIGRLMSAKNELVNSEIMHEMHENRLTEQPAPSCVS